MRRLKTFRCHPTWCLACLRGHRVVSPKSSTPSQTATQLSPELSVPCNLKSSEDHQAYQRRDSQTRANASSLVFPSTVSDAQHITSALSQNLSLNHAGNGPSHSDESLILSPSHHDNNAMDKFAPVQLENLDTLRTLGSCIAPEMFVLANSHLTFDQKYMTLSLLGKGSYGQVYKCQDRHTGTLYALKLLKKKKHSKSRIDYHSEVEFLRKLDHPNIMRLYEFFENDNFIYLITELYTGGELFDSIIKQRKFTEHDASLTMHQILSGVAYLHSHHIVHRDLKPENLLYASEEPDSLLKICDFGLSAYFDAHTVLNERYGTSYYIAPEVLKQTYHESCDLWSVGVILYILLCGYPPFGGRSDRDIIKNVRTGVYTFDPADWEDISNSARDLVQRMLTLNPDHRITASDALLHPWIVRSLGHRVMPDFHSNLEMALNRMRAFYVDQNFARAIFLFIGSQLVTLEESKALTNIFRQLDRNSDGLLDREELLYGYMTLRQVLVSETTGHELLVDKDQLENEVDQILRRADFNKDGFIAYSEFLTVATDMRQLLSTDRLRKAFDTFDRDGSGKIAVDELRQIFHMDPGSWKAILSQVDTNRDGEIDFDEFLHMMMNLTKSEEVIHQVTGSLET